MKIDLGSGPTPREGWIRVDDNPRSIPDILMTMQQYVETLKDNSVDEARACGCLGFLEGQEIYDLMNHLWRALKPEALLKVEVTCVVYPTGMPNPHAYTVPLIKTQISMQTFKCFTGGSTYDQRGVLPWNILQAVHSHAGWLQVDMTPRKPARELNPEEQEVLKKNMIPRIV